MGQKEYIFNRLIHTILTVFIVIIINFFLFRVMPANPVDMLLSPLAGPGEAMRPEIREELVRSLGLDRPMHEQFFEYLKNVLTGNFGISFVTKRPVLSMISERVLNTLVLMISSNILSILLAVSIGVLAAWKRGGKMDILSLISALTFTSMPMFWIGGILLLIFSVRLDLFPLFGTHQIGVVYPNAFSYISDYLHHLFLPMVTMTFLSYGGLFLIMRSTLLDVFSEDYILTARAIGLSNRGILFKNSLRNALLPLITVISIRFGYIMGGSLLTETVFSWPGLGLMVYHAVNGRDYPVLQGSFLIITVLVIVANFFADLIYGYIDPRIRTGETITI